MGWIQYIKQRLGSDDVPVVEESAGDLHPEPVAANNETDSQAVPVQQRLHTARQMLMEGKVPEAVEIYHEVLQEDPVNADATHVLGLISMQNGDLAAAESSIRQAIGFDGRKADYHSNLGLVLVAKARFEEAEQSFRQAISIEPDHLTALGNLANVLLSLQRPRESEDIARNLLQRAPRDLDGFVSLSAALMQQNRVQDAVTVVREGLRYNPEDLGLLMQLASASELINGLTEAQEAIQKAEVLAPDLSSVALLSGIVQRRLGNLRAAEQKLQRALSLGLNTSEQIEAFNQLGLTLDALGSPTEAFEAFSRSNQLIGQGVESERVNGRRFLQEVGAVQAFFSKKVLQELGAARAGEEDLELIFFVGFPRSGTTLMEQILKNHPRLITTDEDSPLAGVLREVRNTGPGYPAYLANADEGFINQLRQQFYSECRQRFGDLTGKRLVDKLPLNIVHLGLVSALFPNAKIVVALRDPRDVCLSCYMQKFRLNDAMVNFLEIKTTALAYHAVMGLWLHYREVLNIPWMEYKYEDLVSNFDATVASVLEFIGVEWDDIIREYREQTLKTQVITPSYRDVTAPINNHAVARWRAYEQELKEVLPELSPYVTEFGYQPG